MQHSFAGGDQTHMEARVGDGCWIGALPHYWDKAPDISNLGKEALVWLSVGRFSPSQWGRHGVGARVTSLLQSGSRER